MDSIAEYLLSITAAAIVCAVVKHMVSRDSTGGRIIKIAVGIFMLVTVFSPLLNGSMKDLEDYLNEFYISGDDVTANGTEKANNELKQIIKQQSEAYILEEAERMSLSLQIEVNIADTNPPVPDAVTLSGSISPYKKEQLTAYIRENFGIAQENLKWN